MGYDEADDVGMSQHHSRSQGGLDRRHVDGFRHRADDAPQPPPLVKELNRGDAVNPLVNGDLRVPVSVEPEAPDLAVEFLSDLVDDAGDHDAGPAPGGPELHEDGRVAALDGGRPGARRDRLG